jgi:hypothetical protein
MILVIAAGTGFVGPNTTEALMKKFVDTDFSQDRMISG